MMNDIEIKLIEANDFLKQLQEDDIVLCLNSFMSLFNISIRKDDPDMIKKYAFRFYEYIKEHKEEIVCWLIEKYCARDFVKFIESMNKPFFLSFRGLISCFAFSIFREDDKLTMDKIKEKNEYRKVLVDMFKKNDVYDEEPTLISLLYMVCDELNI